MMQIKRMPFCHSAYICIFFISYLFPLVNQPEKIVSDKKGNYIKKKSVMEEISFELTKNYDVLHYQIHLNIFPNTQKIYGNTVIKLKVLESPFDSIYFNFSGLSVDSIVCSNKQLSFKHEYDVIISFFSKRLMPGDSVEITIYYHGIPERGIYFTNNDYNDKLVYSHNEPFDAHYWFPCKDDPSDKALSDLSITLPGEYLVLSNGILMDESLTQSGWKTTFWRENYPIATYLISIAAAPYLIIERDFYWGGSSMPLQYYIYQQNREKAVKALESTEEMMNFFSEYIGYYPFIEEKYAMAEVPFKNVGAMENQTATTMNDKIMDDKNVIAHELAHQWWGDALTPYSFDDIWLNEGFASYFDALFTEFKYGSTSFKRQLEQYRSAIDEDGSLDYPVYAPPENYLFGRSVYYKGAWILHMLRNLVGDNRFKEICQNYYRLYRYSNVTTDKFIHICDSVSGKSLYHFFNQWLNYGGIPLLHVNWEQDKDKVKILIEQKQSEIVYQFDIEILLKGTKSDSLIIIPIGSKEESVEFKFSGTVLSIDVDPEDKILFFIYYSNIKIPRKPKLMEVYPNPSTSDVTISYQLDKIQHIEIEIWNILGQKVATVFKGHETHGYKKRSWQTNNIASGIYYCILHSVQGIDVMRMVIIK
jgi:aminopeptidase N